jgi:hypothetical protein
LRLSKPKHHRARTLSEPRLFPKARAVHSSSDKTELQSRISTHLQSVVQGREALKANDAALAGVMALKRYQSARLRASYADLHAQPRYRAAVEFFTDDLYSDRDYSKRDADLLRIVPQIAKLFPLEALATVEAALHLHALAERLDQAMSAAAEHALQWNEASYGAAWQAVGARSERDTQLALVQLTGERLDRLVRLPLIGISLRAMAGPAALAGLSELHGFLLRGFVAFKAMRGATDFLSTIQSREAALMRALFKQA